MLHLIQNCFCISFRNVNHVTSKKSLNPSLLYCSMITFLIHTLTTVDSKVWHIFQSSFMDPLILANTPTYKWMWLEWSPYFPPIRNICSFIINHIFSCEVSEKYDKLGIILDIGPFYCYKCLSSVLNVCLDIFLIKKFYLGVNSPV